MTSSPRNPTREPQARSIIVLTLVLAATTFISVKASPFTAWGADAAAGTIDIAPITIPSVPPPAPDRRTAAASVESADKGQGQRTVFDSDNPAVANLDPDLRKALQRAAADARGEVEFEVNSGWRSADYQEQLLREAIAKYGSEKEAARWVAPPEKSAHVSGDAVDIGPTSAAAWLADHGDDYGLCRTYKNEPWHFELFPDAVEDGCPAMYADPTKDPRLQ